MNRFVKSLENREVGIGLLIDIHKELDTVDHTILLENCIIMASEAWHIIGSPDIKWEDIFI